MVISVFEENQLKEYLEFIARDSSVNQGEYCIRTSFGTKPLGQLELWPPSSQVFHSYGLKQDQFEARAVYRRPIASSKDLERQLRHEQMDLLGEIWQELTPPTSIPYLKITLDKEGKGLLVTNKIRSLSKVVDHEMYRLEAAQRGRRIRVR